MQKYSFGTIVSSQSNRPEATHLPFLVEKTETGIVISSHFGKANPQTKSINNKEVLIIFSEPHAYSSPRHYDNEQSVPTWNYISVHAYGDCKLIEEETSKFELLERTILNYEKAYQEQWDGLSPNFKERMVKGIVAFKVKVTELQAKNKLSQNKTLAERQSIITELSASSNSTEVQLAEYMTLNFKK